MDIRMNLGDLSTPNDVLRLTSIISELADDLDMLQTTTAPNGTSVARQGKIALYDNGVTKELWINTDGNTAWQRVDYAAYTPPSYNTVPSGGIIMWSGSVATIPSGWFICDGNNSTPDLRDKFIVGAGSTYAVAATGGAATVTLTGAQSGLPAHSHNILGENDSVGGSTNPTFAGTTTTKTKSTEAVAAANASQAHENLPPYYALAYIMKS